MEKNGKDQLHGLKKLLMRRRVSEDRQILNSIWQRKHRWIGHVLRHDGLLHEIIEGRMRGKPTRGRRRIQMLHDLANGGGFVVLKGAAEDREGWRQTEDVKNLLYSRRLLMMMSFYPDKRPAANLHANGTVSD